MRFFYSFFAFLFLVGCQDIEKLKEDNLRLALENYRLNNKMEGYESLTDSWYRELHALHSSYEEAITHVYYCNWLDNIEFKYLKDSSCSPSDYMYKRGLNILAQAANIDKKVEEGEALDVKDKVRLGNFRIDPATVKHNETLLLLHKLITIIIASAILFVPLFLGWLTYRWAKAGLLNKRINKIEKTLASKEDEFTYLENLLDEESSIKEKIKVAENTYKIYAGNSSKMKKKAKSIESKLSYLKIEVEELSIKKIALMKTCEELNIQIEQGNDDLF